MDILPIIAYLALASVAAERVTDMVKRLGAIDYLANNGPIKHGLLCQLVSATSGGLLCYLSPPDLHLELSRIAMSILVWLSVSGGSSVWSDLLQTLSAYRKGLQSLNQ